MLGIDAKETVEFVSKKDVGDAKTIFILRNFLNSDRLKIGLGSSGSDGKFNIEKFKDKIFDIIMAGVVTIKNLGGKDYPGMSLELLEVIPFDVLTELFEKIWSINFPSEAETKN